MFFLHDNFLVQLLALFVYLMENVLNAVPNHEIYNEFFSFSFCARTADDSRQEKGAFEESSNVGVDISVGWRNAAEIWPDIYGSFTDWVAPFKGYSQETFNNIASVSIPFWKIRKRKS